MDPLKEAFSKVKEDIDLLKEELTFLGQQIIEIKEAFASFQQTNRQTNQSTDTSFLSETSNPTLQQTQDVQIPAQNLNFPAETDTYSDKSTDNLPLESLRSLISNISTGNRGVPTDRQTNQQTDKHTQNTLKNTDMSNLLDSLDSLKLDLRNKFETLTNQEFLIYTTIYQLELEGNKVEYSLLSKKLNLSPSSIRDYVLKLSKKQIPLSKTKESNKKVFLSIPPEVKKLASLSSIISLKENVFRLNE